ncbi:reverse transcriptase domain-containing protein [Tanacetum coccineum]
MKKVRETPPSSTKGVLSCTKAKEKVVNNDRYPEQTVTIGKQLLEHFKERLRDLLGSNADVFAWTHVDITGIPRTIMVEGKPFKTEHKTGGANEGRNTKESQTSDMGSQPLHGEGFFSYRKMPFGLKNAGATYQRLVDKVFQDQIKRNLEAYVDDMVIKSTFEEDMLVDIKETFERFRSINMKLNPKKCSFGIKEGPYLGHLITKKGIRANPSKVKSIIDVK